MHRLWAAPQKGIWFRSSGQRKPPSFGFHCPARAGWTAGCSGRLLKKSFLFSQFCLTLQQNTVSAAPHVWLHPSPHNCRRHPPVIICLCRDNSGDWTQFLPAAVMRNTIAHSVPHLYCCIVQISTWAKLQDIQLYQPDSVLFLVDFILQPERAGRWVNYCSEFVILTAANTVAQPGPGTTAAVLPCVVQG